MKKTYAQKAKDLYKKQMRRIKDLRKRGYIIPDPKPLPKRIGKKEYERLEKKLTLEELYNSSNSYYIETNTKGEQKMVSAKRGREIERSRAGKKASITRKQKKITGALPIAPQWEDVVIDGIREQIKELSRGIVEVANDLANVLDYAIEQDGKFETAERIYNSEQKTDDVIGEIIFYYETYNRMSYRLVNDFKQLLLGRNLPQNERYIEKLNFEDNSEDYMGA